MNNPDSNKYESALLKLIEDWTGRETGTNLYVGELSTGQLEVTAIMLDAEIIGEDTDGLRKYNGRYIGKFEERADCLTEMDKIKQNLIQYSKDIVIDGGETVKLHQIRQRGGEALYETKDDGADIWNFVLNLIIEFNPA